MRLLVAVADEGAVVRRETMIHLDVELVVLALQVRRDQVVVDRLAGRADAARGVRLRIELGQDVGRRRVPATGRDDVARERLAGQRVVDGAVDLGEVALAHLRRGHGREVGLAGPDAQALVVGEEERLVLDDRPAEGGAELVLREVRLRAAGLVQEEVVRIEAIVAQELEHAAVEVVRARLDLQVHDAAERLTELGRVGAGLDLELLERVDAREDHDRLQPGLVVVDAVEHVVVVAGALAVGRERRRRAPGERARAVDVRARAAAQDAGHRARQADEVAAVEGQRLDLLLDDRGAEIGGCRLQQRRLGLDLDDLGHRPELEREVHAHPLVDADVDVREGDRLEAGQAGGHGVGARGQRRGRVLALGIGHELSLVARAVLRQRHRGAGHDGARRVLDRAEDRPADGLGAQRRRRQTAHNGQTRDDEFHQADCRLSSRHSVASQLHLRAAGRGPHSARAIASHAPTPTSV